MKIFAILFFALAITSCSGGDGDTSSGGDGDTSSTDSGNSSGNTTGTILLSGNDTAIIGTQLNTGFVGSSLAASGQPNYIVIVDAASTVSFTEPNILTPNLADIDNGLILVVTDASSTSGFKGISMSISVGGIKNDYACTTPVSTFIDCGINSISLDIENKTVIFDNLIVTNTNTSTVLTINGTLEW